MPPPSKTLLIEGSFSELAEEFAQYVDNVRKSQQNEETPSVHAEIAPTIAELSQLQKQEQEQEDGLSTEQNNRMMEQRTAIMKVLVTASPSLNSAPEKEITAAYNLLVHLIYQTSQANIFLPRICQALSQPITSSPQHGPSLALSILSTIFNTLTPENPSRYHIFLAILSVIRSAPSSGTASAFDALKPQLASSLPEWIVAWDLDEEDARKLHLAISAAAAESGDPNLSYTHLLHALETIPPNEASNPDSRSLASRALTTALCLPNLFDFIPLTSSDAIQSLRRSDPSLFELLEIFAADTLDSYEDFLAQSPNPISSIPGLSSSGQALQTKMRLLTLSSIAAATPSRSLPYSQIASALRIPGEDVEKWVIDTIRAGLVEGKLSQLKGEFLVQRATYRVFGEKQWSEVQGRLMVWRRSLEGVLGVVRAEREKMLREAQGGGGRGDTNGYGHEGQQQQQMGGPRRGGGGRREADFVGTD